MKVMNARMSFMQDEIDPGKKVASMLMSNLKSSPAAHNFTRLFSSLFTLNNAGQCVLPAVNVPMTIAAVVR